MDDIYDLVVIGAGPAGEVAAELAASFGRRALVVERSKPGGVVTTTGGAPTKALREAAVYLTGYPPGGGLRRPGHGAARRDPSDPSAPGSSGCVTSCRGPSSSGSPPGASWTSRESPASERTAPSASPHPTGWSTSWWRARSWWRRGPARRTTRVSRSTIPMSTTPTRSTRSTGSPRTSSSSAVARSASSSPRCSPRSASRRRSSARSERLLPAVDGELAGPAAAEFGRRGVRLAPGARREAGAPVWRRSADRDSLHRRRPRDGRRSVRYRPHAQHRRPRPRGGRRSARCPRTDLRRPLLPDDRARDLRGGGRGRPWRSPRTAMQQGRAAAAHACGLMFGVVVDRTGHHCRLRPARRSPALERPRRRCAPPASPTRSAAATWPHRARGDRRPRRSAQADHPRR